MTTELAVQTSGEIISTQELRAGLQAAKEQQTILGLFVRDVMTEGIDYGTIPGTEKIVNGQKVPNRTLLKPGAEKLIALFKCSPKFHIRRREDPDNGIYAYEFRCEIYSAAGALVAEGFGSASSMESKHRWRTAQRVCPKCKGSFIQVSKFEDKSGGEFGVGSYYCFQKLGGCGVKYKAGDKSIEDQKLGRTENPDMADVANSVLKMAKKRSMVDAALALSRCSDLFGQDLEDFQDVAPVAPKVETQAELVERVRAQVKADHEKVMGKPPLPITQEELGKAHAEAFPIPAGAVLESNPFATEPEFSPEDRKTTLARDQLTNFKFPSGPRRGQFVSSASSSDLKQIHDYLQDLEAKKPEKDSKSLGNLQLLEAITHHIMIKDAAANEAEMAALTKERGEEVPTK